MKNNFSRSVVCPLESKLATTIIAIKKSSFDQWSGWKLQLAELLIFCPSSSIECEFLSSRALKSKRQIRTTTRYKTFVRVELDFVDEVSAVPIRCSLIMSKALALDSS